MNEAESRFLLLAARPGYESLRRDCPIPWSGEHGKTCGTWGVHPQSKGCQGRGWLPLPMPERMGALLALCDQVTFIKTGDRASEVELCWEQTFYYGNAPTPEAALIEALLAAAGFERQPQP